MALTLASLHIHPVKSLGGFAVGEALLTDRGLEHDRRWMLVRADGVFVSQRELPAMALLHTAPMDDGFRVTDIRDGAVLELPWCIMEGDDVTASVWEDRVDTRAGQAAWDAWFSERLGTSLRLVHMPDASQRPTDGRFADGLTSLSDGYPCLIISQASLDDLNARLPESVPMDRFRPNMVIAGGHGFQEDGWRELRIGDARFSLVKPCARCVMVTIDQRTAERGAEPLRTLATFRAACNKVLFGMNAMCAAGSVVRVGDPVVPW